LRATAISAVGLAAPTLILKPRIFDPFLGVDWPRTLAAAGGVYERLCGAALDRPHYFFRGSKGHGGYPVLSAAAAGLDRSSGRWLAVIPMHCGGTAAVTHFGVFAATSADPEFLAVIRPGYKSSVFFKDGAVHIASAVLEARDPNCRPSNMRVAQYDFSKGTPVAVRESTMQTSHFRPFFARYFREQRLQVSNALVA
jgi:hypothetical protein